MRQKCINCVHCWRRKELIIDSKTKKGAIIDHYICGFQAITYADWRILKVAAFQYNNCKAYFYDEQAGYRRGLEKIWKNKKYQ